MTSGNQPQREHGESLRPFKQGRLIGRELHHVKSTGSTMDDLAAAAREGAGEGLVVVADQQTSGRGRHSRKWEAAAGDDLLFSVLFRPRPAIAGEVNMLLALAIAETVDEACAVESKVKWPNDVRVDGAKVSGILLESVQDANGIAIVAGIGLNVNSRMRDMKPGGTEAVSMSELKGTRFDRSLVLEDLLGRIEQSYADICAGGTVVPAWRERLDTIGRQVTVTFLGSTAEPASLEGFAEDVDESGRLMVRDENGYVRAVSAGEVTLRPNGNGG